MNRVARWVAVVLAFALVAVGPGQPGSAAAAADDPVIPSETAVGTFESGGVKGFGYKCDLGVYWTTATDGGNFLRGTYACSTGFLRDDTIVSLWVDPEPSVGDPSVDCDPVRMVAGKNIDEADERTGSFGPVFAGEGCGAVTSFCVQVDTDAGEPFSGDSASEYWGYRSSRCRALDLGAPVSVDGEAADWYNSEVTGCAAYSALEPWVTSPQPVAVSGGWVWESSVTVTLVGYEAGDNLGGQSLIPMVVASVPGAASVVSADAYSSVNTSPQGTNRWVGANFYVNGPSGWAAVGTRSFKVRGPVHTGSPGSTALDWQFGGVGVLWLGGANAGQTFSANTSTHPESHSSRPSVASIAGDFGEYGAHHDPERCHFWWGQDMFTTDTSGYDTPAGPLTFRASPDVPEPLPPAVPPPVIEFDPEGDGCDPGATECIPSTPLPDADGPPTLPDPDDTGSGGACDFSITNPTTWGGQLICALVELARMVIGVVEDGLALIGSLIDAVLGLVDALLDGLVALLVPDEFPDFTGITMPVPEGWIPSLPSLSDGECGPLSFPQLDMAMLGTIGPTEFADTCEAPWPTVRTLTYYGLLAGVLITVGHRALRVVMTGLGMNVDNGGGGDGDD